MQIANSKIIVDLLTEMKSYNATDVKGCKLKELIKEYVRIYGHNEWGVATYDGNIGLINNYIIPTIGEVQLSEINNHFMEKYYTDLLKMPAVKSSRNPDGDKLITADPFCNWFRQCRY